MPDRYQPSGTETEFEPGSRNRVLRNLVGIRSVREMEQAESHALLEATEGMLSRFSADQTFTAEDIRGMHRQWLGGIYEWAGEYRQVNITKDGFPFAAASLVPRLMAEFEAGALRRLTPLKISPQHADDIPHGLAEVHAELILIHPFREGNGRCARLLASLMALQQGLPPLDFSAIKGSRRRDYIAAVHAAVARDYRPMAKVFRDVLKRTLRAYGKGGPPLS